MESTLASREDAATILKLYELRQEPVLRKARAWVRDFWPTSAEEIIVVIEDAGSERNAWFRQSTTYWDMAAALVNHGVLAMDLFLDTSAEAFLIAAKLWPYLQEVREHRPDCLAQIEKLVERSASARQKLEGMQGRVRKRLGQLEAPPMPEIQRPD
jgi:hypothetical protein